MTSFLSMARPLVRPKSWYSRDELPFLGQDLDAMVVAIGDDQPTLGIELERVRRPELARSSAGLADESEKLSVPVEHRDAPDQIGIRHVGMALGDVDVAVLGSVTTSVGSVRASGGFPLTPGFPNVIRTLPSGLNFTTTLPFLPSPGNFGRSSGLGAVRRSPTHFHPDRHGYHAATRTCHRQSS